MDTEILLLLAVPAAFLIFGLGWLAARVDIKHLLEGSRAIPSSYFRGLNFLLNEQPDRAIDSFIEAVQKDPEALELHLTLGSMFRRRGETDRAIRLHQSLLARADLDERGRVRATLELGHDFLKAGMLDRAEALFLGLQRSAVDIEARLALIEIYEIEKEWRKAIDVAQTLADQDDARIGPRIAHFHCELAQASLARSALDDAQTEVTAALQVDRQCVRASIIAGDIAVARQQLGEAIAAWLAVERQSPVHLALVGERLMAAHRQLNRSAEGLRLLKSMLEQVPSIDLLDVVARETQAQQGAQAAYDVVLGELKRTPTLLTLSRLVDARLNVAAPEHGQELDVVRALLKQYTQRSSRYVCSYCGFKAKQFYWQCPGCRTWNAYAPRRVEELEGMQ